MNGHIILVGYDDDGVDKLLRIEVTCEGEGDGLIDIVRFLDLKVSINRETLLDAIEFLKEH